MKGIKFRAWDHTENKMISWDSLTQTTHNNKETNLLYDVLVAKSSNFSIMQFTGVKDKNDVEIYEGDIVKCPVTINPHIHGKFSNRVVKWKDDSFTFVFDSDFAWIRFEDSVSNDGDYITYNDEGVVMKIKVIGNIYNNPELLNK